jgi:hypothetical protein
MLARRAFTRSYSDSRSAPGKLLPVGGTEAGIYAAAGAGAPPHTAHGSAAAKGPRIAGRGAPSGDAARRSGAGAGRGAGRGGTGRGTLSGGGGGAGRSGVCTKCTGVLKPPRGRVGRSGWRGQPQ